MKHALRTLSLALALLVTAAVVTPTAAQDGSPSSDRDALVALYNATDGPNWKNAPNWLSDKPLGTWWGVDTDADGRVTKLVLIANNLTAQIPSELGRLSNLELLELSRNSLSGQIPSELGELSNLKLLHLYNNQLPQIPHLTLLSEALVVLQRVFGVDSWHVWAVQDVGRAWGGVLEVIGIAVTPVRALFRPKKAWPGLATRLSRLQTDAPGRVAYARYGSAASANILSRALSSNSYEGWPRASRMINLLA